MNHTIQDTVKFICQALQEKKGTDIEVLHVEELTTLTEYFVICSANSTTQVKALADNVEFRLKNDHDITVHHSEGFSSSSWILLDFSGVLVHVFLPDTRKFYNLENLWQDGVTVPLENFGITAE